MTKTYRVDKCNPDVHHPNMKLYSLHQALLFFLFSLPFVLPCPDRLKHVILRFYYPKREKKRQIKLYTDILLAREKFIQLAMKRIIYVRVHGKMTKLHDPKWQDLLLRQFRSFSFILGYFFKTSCSICKSKGASRFVMCKGPGCTMVYCPQCWQILGEKCLNCNLVITQEMIERFATQEEGLFTKKKKK